MDYRPCILLAVFACQPSDGNRKKRADKPIDTATTYVESTKTGRPLGTGPGTTGTPGYPRPGCAPEDPGPTLLGAARYSIGKGTVGTSVWLDGTFLSTLLGGDSYASIPGTWYTANLNAAGQAAAADAEASIGALAPATSDPYPGYSWSELVVCRAGVQEVWQHDYTTYTTYGTQPEWVALPPEVAPAWGFFMAVWADLETCTEGGYLENTNGC